MVKWLVREWKRFLCRLDFMFLSDWNKALFRDMGLDPDSLIRRGEL